jgi:hypothetical protein
MNLLFLFGCIPVRLLLAYLGATLNQEYLPYFGALLLVMSLGFLTLYFTNGRLNAPEAGGKTWWANLRLIHGLLYLAAAIYAIQKTNVAWIPLSIDVLFGLFAYFFIKKQN